MERFGIVAFAFGYRKDDPGVSNRALAQVVERLKRDFHIQVVVLQHEIMDCMPCADPECMENNNVFSINANPGQYLDSEEVMRQAIPYLKEAYVKSVFVVAQPFLRLHKCIGLAKQSGFEPIVPENMKIPFDKESEQEWTRSRIKLLIHAIKQKLLGHRDK